MFVGVISSKANQRPVSARGSREELSRSGKDGTNRIQSQETIEYFGDLLGHVGLRRSCGTSGVCV